jgi:ATP-binding cassette, subfamily B, bacterial CvaB/MchF/RaxB
VKLAALALVALLFHVIVRVVSFSLEREANEEAIIAGAKEQSTMIESLRGILTLRLAGAENIRHALWQSRLTAAVNADVRSRRVTVWQGSLNALIFGIEAVASIWIALGMVMVGQMTVGMVFAYIAYKTQFLTKAAPLVDQIMAFRMLGLHLERLSDIALAADDICYLHSESVRRVLTGRIELRNASFRYGPTAPLVFENVNLIVEPGEHVAITGPSGGGKSTLMKVLIGLHPPTEGELLVDSLPIRQFGYRNLYGQCAAILQEDNLFTGSLRDNISMFDDSTDMDRVVSAARAAAIHEDILSMPMGYETLVGDMGSGLSGGQKQRVLLARALYREPRMLIVDAGTSHVDAACEARINESIGRLGCTRIIIAHRIETLLAADRVLILADGRLTEAEAGRISALADASSTRPASQAVSRRFPLDPETI